MLTAAESGGGGGAAVSRPNLISFHGRNDASKSSFPAAHRMFIRSSVLVRVRLGKIHVIKTDTRRDTCRYAGLC